MNQRKSRTHVKSSTPISITIPKPVWVGLGAILIIVVAVLFWPTSTANPSDLQGGHTIHTEPLDSTKQSTLIRRNGSSQKTPPKAVSVRQPQIEILNGCGVSGIANQFKAFFRSQKVDVIAVGNYSDFNQPKTFLILHSGRHETLCNELAKKLNVTIIKRDIQAVPTQEMTLVIGQDYGALNMKVRE